MTPSKRNNRKDYWNVIIACYKATKYQLRLSKCYVECRLRDIYSKKPTIFAVKVFFWLTDKYWFIKSVLPWQNISKRQRKKNLISFIFFFKFFDISMLHSQGSIERQYANEMKINGWNSREFLNKGSVNFRENLLIQECNSCHSYL